MYSTLKLKNTEWILLKIVILCLINCAKKLNY